MLPVGRSAVSGVVEYEGHQPPGARKPLIRAMCESWIRAISKPQPSAKIKRYENNELVTGRKPRDKTRDWSEAKRQDKSHSWSNETRQSPEQTLKEAREDARHHMHTTTSLRASAPFQDIHGFTTPIGGHWRWTNTLNKVAYSLAMTAPCFRHEQLC